MNSQCPVEQEPFVSHCFRHTPHSTVLFLKWNTHYEINGDVAHTSQWSLPENFPKNVLHASASMRIKESARGYVGHH